MKKTRKDFSKPEKSDLVKGNILPVYSNFTEEKGFRGNAELIERKPSKWRDEKNGFIRTIIGGTDQKEGYAVMWKFQRWVIRFVDGPYKGHTTCENIGYFYSYSFLDKGDEEE